MLSGWILFCCTKPSVIVNDHFCFCYVALSLCVGFPGRAMTKALACAWSGGFGPYTAALWAQVTISSRKSTITLLLSLLGEVLCLLREEWMHLPLLLPQDRSLPPSCNVTQFLEYPHIITLLILVCVVSMVLIIGNATQGFSQRQSVLRWASCVEGIGHIPEALPAFNGLGLHALAGM